MSNLDTIYKELLLEVGILGGSSDTKIVKKMNVEGLINLRNCKLAAIPLYTLAKINPLKLDLSYNNIESIPELFCEKMTNLQHLNLDYTDVYYIADNVYHLKNLEVLEMIETTRNEKIFALPASFRHMKKLRRLGVSGRNMGDLPEWFGELKSMEVLKLGMNRLKKVPDCIRELTNLRELNLYNNQITELPSWIVELENLEKLRINSNPIDNDQKFAVTNVRKLLNRIHPNDVFVD